ncbi:SDR family NAD(P)-dependent oxidoreductase [Demequina iriomotensis]|uniref:SDR family NAD(P)-dependent oxidoreductase n=1 Tax=Demequina iriomotensis TaxID=1536641 RepID=UPI0007854D0D|nr:SDR family oxidoreductase [Demequina iriomotensis]
MTASFPDVSARPLAELTSLAGRVGVVTGGVQGLGRAIAERLAEAGATVVIADLDAARAAAAAEQVAERHRVRALGVAMDVASAADVDRAAEELASELGRVDIWVNNAGVFPSALLATMTDEAWDQVFAVNVRGVRNGSRAAARLMGAGGGAIVNIASLAAFEGTAPGLGAYVASKHAVRGLTRQLALELAPQGIRVLGVAPTFVPTEGNIAAAMAASGGAAPGVNMPQPKSLAGRMGTPDDVARIVLFCASDMSAFMTGSTLLADAGAHA